MLQKRFWNYLTCLIPVRSCSTIRRLNVLSPLGDRREPTSSQVRHLCQVVTFRLLPPRCQCTLLQTCCCYTRNVRNCCTWNVELDEISELDRWTGSMMNQIDELDQRIRFVNWISAWSTLAKPYGIYMGLNSTASCEASAVLINMAPTGCLPLNCSTYRLKEKKLFLLLTRFIIHNTTWCWFK